MKSKDLTGMRFNNLTVIGAGKGSCRNKKYWKCRCDCGNITNVETSKLVSLHTKSCGCSKKLAQLDDISGKTFGYITVVSFAYIKDGKPFWNCRCVCGKEIVKQGKLLKNGHIVSCGCMKGKSRIADLSGKRFGRLLALRVDNTKEGVNWLCKCDCGNIAVVSSRSLLSGNTKSCGCFRKINTTRKDLQGKRFGKLSVIKYLRTEEKKTIWLCKCDCGNIVEVKGQYLIHGETKSCGCMQVISFGEKSVYDFIKSVYDGTTIGNDRELIAPKELDIYVPDKKFAVEYDGLYWHSEAVRTDINYHKNKTFSCLSKGVRLLHIYENEWRDKQEICKSMISSALGVYERKEFARNCRVREVNDRKAVIDFFDRNHIQGAVHKFSLALGLYKGDDLLQVCVFGKHNFGRNGDVELYRMATVLNTQVLGGFSKIMEHCPYDTVVSYVSLRMFDGRGYFAGKWVVEHTAQPSFCLTDGVNTYSRHLFKKSECLKKFDNVSDNMTEREMQVKNGFYRLWDCGTYKVRWRR